MSADAFTTAARAEANKLTEHWGGERNRRRFLSIFTSGAEWARDHLAQQDPTEAEIRAVMKVARTHYSMPLGVGPSFARAVIEAARAARRDEEKRDD